MLCYAGQFTNKEEGGYFGEKYHLTLPTGLLGPPMVSPAPLLAFSTTTNLLLWIAQCAHTLLNQVRCIQTETSDTCSSS